MREEYNKRLAEGLRVNNSNDTPSRLLNFTQHETRARENQENFIESPPLPKRASRKIIRIIPTTADKILDAPDLIDDYYLNLLDWGPGNVIAVALESCVYLWNAESSEINMLMQCEDEEEYVTSVSWAGDGKHVAIGTSSAAVSLWDAETAAPLRNLPGHSARVSALAWNRDILSTGGRDSLIINHDVRYDCRNVCGFIFCSSM